MANANLGKKLLDNQVVRFILSAGTGFLVDIGMFSLLYHNWLTQKMYNIFTFPVRNYYVSFSISFFLGVLTNFLITRYFVFSESKLPPYKQFFRFASVATLGYFANLALLTFFIQTLHTNPLVARPSSALTLFFLSYFVHKFFSFSLSLRHHAVGEPHPKSS